MSSNNDVRDIAIQIGSAGERNRDASGGIRGFEFQKSDQLFFSSCDERICELLRYKMGGYGIKVADINGSMFQ